MTCRCRGSNPGPPGSRSNALSTAPQPRLPNIYWPFYIIYIQGLTQYVGVSNMYDMYNLNTTKIFPLTINFRIHEKIVLLLTYTLYRQCEHCVPTCHPGFIQTLKIAWFQVQEWKMLKVLKFNWKVLEYLQIKICRIFKHYFTSFSIKKMSRKWVSAV